MSEFLNFVIILKYLSRFLIFTQYKMPNAFVHIILIAASELRSKTRKKIMLQEHNFTSFFPKSPPGFMVAKIRNFFPAVNSSTSLSLSSTLPFSANTRDFSTSRTLKDRNIREYKIRKGLCNVSILWSSSSFKKEKKLSPLLSFYLVNTFLARILK